MALYGNILPALTVLLTFLANLNQANGYSVPTLQMNTNNPVKYGSHVSMVCTVQLPESDGLYLSLEWGKTDTDTFINSPFALFGLTYSSSGQNPAAVYSSQHSIWPPGYDVSFDLSSGVSVFNISSAVLGDTGFYWCSYSSGNNPKGRISVELNVYAVSISVSLSYQSKIYNPGDTIELIAGESYDLFCSLEAVFEPATITWEIRDGSLPPELYTQTDEANSEEPSLWDSQSMLSLGADWSFYNQQLWCNASVAVSKASSYLEIDIMVPPDSNSISLSDDRQSEGYTEGAIVSAINEQKHTITCDVRGTRPAVEIQWKINGADPPEEFEINHVNTSDESGLYDTRSEMRFSPTTMWHWATVECIAVLNIHQKVYKENRGVILEVLGISDPPSIFGSMDLIENQEEEFTCVSPNGYPMASIEWMLDGTNVTQSSATNVFDVRHKTYLSESLLRFTPVSSDNGKTLTCQVTRIVGDEPMTKSTSGVFNVKYSPRVSISKTPGGAIEEGGSVTLTCSSDANPPSSHFDWVKGDGLGDGSNILTLNSITKVEEGSYRCKAQNAIGLAGVSEPVDVRLTETPNLANRASLLTETESPSSTEVSKHSSEPTMEQTTTMEIATRTFTSTMKSTPESSHRNTSEDDELQTPTTTDLPPPTTTTATTSPPVKTSKPHVSTTDFAGQNKPCISNTNDLEKAVNEFQKASPGTKFTTSTDTDKKITINDVTITFPRSAKQLDITVMQSSSPQSACPITFENDQQSYRLSSPISVTAVGNNGTSVTELQNEIKFEFMTKKPDVNAIGQLYFQPKCSWWDSQNKYWSDKGCRFLGVEENYAYCQCDHLTLFSLVGKTMQFPHTDIQANVVSKLSSVGYAITIVFLILTLVAFFSSGLYKTLRIFIHVNLIVSKLLSCVFLWVAFEGNVKNTTICSWIAGIAQFSCLASYFWICMEAIYVFLMIKPGGVLNSVPVFAWMMMCWVAPLLITLVSAVVKSEGYGVSVYQFDSGHKLHDTTWCWLDLSDGTVWAFGAPATIMLAIYFGLLVLCIQAFIQFIILEDREEQELKQDLNGFRLLLFMFPLMGLPWLFRLTYFHQYTVFFDFFYALMNALQGLFIFVNHCILDEEVFEHLKSKTLVEFQMAIRKNEVKQDQLNVLVDSRAKRPMADNMGSEQSVRKLFNKRNTVAPIGM